MQLAEVLQLLNRQVITREVQQRVQQHRTVAVGNHEAIAVGPGGVGRVVAQEIVPQHFGDIGHAHRHAGMPGVGLLHCIHRKGTDGVGKL